MAYKDVEEKGSESSSQSPNNSILSSFVSVISGARQSASQEFSRFWDTLNTPKSENTRNIATPHSRTQSSSQSSSSSSHDDMDYHTQSIEKRKTETSIYSNIIPDRNKRSCIRDAEIQTDFPSPPDKRKWTSDVESEARPRKLVKLEATKSPVTFSSKKRPEEPKAAFKSSTIPSSPINNDIITGSKSVKSLASELEEALIPRLPSDSPNRPTQSPNRLFLSPTKPTQSPTKAIQSPLKLSTTTTTATTTPYKKPVIDNSLSLQKDHVSSPPRNTASANHHTAYQLGSDLSDVVGSPEEDEDIRLNKLTESIRITRTRVSELMASSVSPPKPTHTLSSYRDYDDSSCIPSSSASPTPLATPPPPPPPPPPPSSSSYSPRLISKAASSSYTSTPSPPEHHRVTSPFTYLSSSPTQSRTTPLRNSILDAHPYFKLHAQQSSSPSKLKPTDKHKEKMRELIYLIPNVQLRKTDTIIGPDGIERPNPYWNEIYNPKRRVY